MNHGVFHSLNLEFSSNLLTCNRASQNFRHFVLYPEVKNRCIRYLKKVNPPLSSYLYFQVLRVKCLATNILPQENIEIKCQPPFRKLQRRHPQ